MVSNCELSVRTSDENVPKNSFSPEVYGLYIADSVQTMIAMHSGFRILCTHWGNIDAVIFPGWTFCVVPIFSGISAITEILFNRKYHWHSAIAVSFPVQAFFAHRVWNLKKAYRSGTANIILNIVIFFIVSVGSKFIRLFIILVYAIFTVCGHASHSCDCYRWPANCNQWYTTIRRTQHRNFCLFSLSWTPLPALNHRIITGLARW